MQPKKGSREPALNSRKQKKKNRSKGKNKQHDGTSGTKDSNGEFINPAAAQPRDENVIEVEKEDLQSNRADTEDTYGGVHTSKNTQASHLGDGNATDKEQSGTAEVSGAETIMATDAVPLLALDGSQGVVKVFSGITEGSGRVQAESQAHGLGNNFIRGLEAAPPQLWMNLDRVEADLASSLPIIPNRFRALEEADTLLQGNWADQVDEWQVSSRKGYKPQWVGNIWVFWREGLAVSLVSLSHQQITVRVNSFLMSFVHASSSYGLHRELWQDLSQLRMNNEAWEVIGDFNIVSVVVERRGGCRPCLTAMNEFNSFIYSNALIDSTTLGYKFSWCNKRWGSRRMLQKLDRMLVNQEWQQGNVGWRSKILTRKLSIDHHYYGLELLHPQTPQHPFSV
ncbi:hypothetical protein IFM89_030895 [Coptis chinensis]|uniref:Uncharacterized protein n=1 Tax=Coptis chinensis TaxID=261450 RepID=A0A835HZ70_9MAGN|nr:hypothetical protein IFM89_030895 [Coptis chinensis]